jgi:hypothetical protein
MKNIQRMLWRTATAVAIVGLAAPAFAVDFSANVELDNSYQSNLDTFDNTTYKADGTVDHLGTGHKNPDATKRGFTQGGRVEFNASGKAGEDSFVAGRATLLAKKDGTSSTDDMWFQLGNKTFDVKLGRFEAANLFPTPGDCFVNVAGGDLGLPQDNTSGNMYQGSALRGRIGESTFHGAATIKTGMGLNFEIGVIEYQMPDTHGDPTADGSKKVKGFRPVGMYSSDTLSAALGLEVIKFDNGNSTTGFAGYVGYNFGVATVNGCLAIGKDSMDKVGGSDRSANKLTTFGVTASTTFGLAGGLMFASNQRNQGVDTHTELDTNGKSTTLYLSYTAGLFDIKNATYTIGAYNSSVGGSYKDDGNDNGVSHYGNDSGLRLRFDYTF